MLEEINPLLNKILTNWPNEPERPPLLINGVGSEEWQALQKNIIEIFTVKPIMLGHPDILYLIRDDKKINIDVESTREFIDQLSLSNFELPFKIGFIPAAHQLNIQSQNALLKTLEEPLKNRYLILGTVSKNKLLPTILSRSITVNYNQNDNTKMLSIDSEIEDFFESCLKISPDKRILNGQIWSEGKTEKVSVFFDSMILLLHRKLIESVKNSNFEKAQSVAGLLKKALNYSEQLTRTSGANPKMLFESFLLGLN